MRSLDKIKESGTRRNRSLPWWQFTLAVLLFCLRCADGAVARDPVKAGDPTAPEKYVLDRLAAGKVANLTEAYPAAASRMIRGVFLEELLSGARKDCVIHRNGVQIEGAIIQEPVDLRNVQITNDTRLTHCQFQSGVNFSRSVFAEGLSVEESTLQGTSDFSEIKVLRTLNLQKATFTGQALFAQAEITGPLWAAGVMFQSSNGLVNFSNLKASSAVLFTNAVFAGGADFRFGRFADNLQLDRAQFLHPTALANFEGVKVEGQTSLSGVSVAGYMSLKDGAFQSLELGDVKRAQRSHGEWLWLNGIRCQRVSAGEERGGARQLLSLVDGAAHGTAYSADIYSSIGEYYRRQGYAREANRFFIAQKRREREEVLRGIKWWWSLFLDWFVGYGRSPERALFWSGSIVLVGMAVFRPRCMEPRTTNLKADIYSPFWYSMDLFLPLVKLQDADMWKPRDDQRFARFWSRIHTILGWALIPIAVAAWTGMLEK
jgi:hypothetical protein